MKTFKQFLAEAKKLKSTKKTRRNPNALPVKNGEFRAKPPLSSYWKEELTEAKKPLSMSHSMKANSADDVRAKLKKLGYQQTGEMKSPAMTHSRYYGGKMYHVKSPGGEYIGTKHTHPDGHRASVNDEFRVTMHAPIEHHNEVRSAMGLRDLDKKVAAQKAHSFSKWKKK